MRKVLVPALIAVALAGCQRQEPAPEASVGPSAEPTAAPPASADASPLPGATARNESVSNELIEFEYKYPAAAAAIPALKKHFDAELDTRRRDLTKDATEARAAAKTGGYPFHAYGYWVEWRTVADLPGWLSLSAEISTYTGGAHPNHWFDALVWDKQAGKRLDPAAMFTSKTALSRAIKAPFCRALDAQRREKRGGDGKLGGGIGEFDQCIDPLENATLLLGSSNGKAFNRIGLLVPPYNAGPYAEGSYEVTLPVTAAVLATVRPEYRATFVTAR
jgi:hypothetical protein